MNRAKGLLFTASILLLLSASCAKQQQYTAIDKICSVDFEKAQLMQAAQETLGKMHFTIDKADAEQGYIRTQPLAGAQFFEFWRKDNVGSFNFNEANLHTIRRIAELKVSQLQEQLCIDCVVKAQRLNLPQQQISSGSQVYKIFSESSSSMQKFKLSDEQKRNMSWIDLGEDHRLQTEILKSLKDQIAKLQKEKRL